MEPKRTRKQARDVIPCHLKPEQGQALRQMAAEEDLPCSTLIRRAVKEMLERAGRV